MNTFKFSIISVVLAVAVSACGETNEPVIDVKAPLVVKTMPIESAQASATRLSGTIEAQQQTPLSFQIGGRIIERAVDAGDRVQAGQLLFALDERDLRQSQATARAQVQSATQALATAKDELARAKELARADFISDQALDQAQLRVTEAQARLESAQAGLVQADNALDYAQLAAPAVGIVTEVTGEVGQVVNAGQPIGEFAVAGAMEIEVFLPQGLTAPQNATVALGNNQWPAQLREVSGAADPGSRTFRARYGLPASVQDIAIGTIADLLLPTEIGADVKRVPIGAIDERGQGPRVWVVRQDTVEPHDVTLLSMSRETAQIRTDLPVGTPVVAMGTHVLAPEQAVQVFAP